MPFALQLDRVAKTFDATPVLEDISLDVAHGEFVSLVGPSGCGKSTLLRIIAGLEIQDRGHVHIADRVVDALGPRARNIAMVFQSYALYPHMSAFDNIALPLTVSRLTLAERLPLIRHLSPRRRRIAVDIAREVADVAAQLQIEPLLPRKPAQLSGGQRQRVALARAMVRRPSLFLMDEPLSNLDAQLRVHMRDELTELHRRLGATFVYVTHDQVEAMTMSTRVAMMDRGRLAQVGAPLDLYERPATLAVATFIGAPMINTFPVTIAAEGVVMLDGRPLRINAALPDGASATLAWRPEALQIVAPGHGAFDAQVRRSEHHGAETLVHLTGLGTGARASIVRLTGAEFAALGDFAPAARVGVAADFSKAHVFDAEGRRVDLRADPVSSMATATGKASLPEPLLAVGA